MIVMKNNEIEQLIRMMREIEDLEASAGTTSARASGGDDAADALGATSYSFAAANERKLALAEVEKARVRSATWWRHAFTAAAVVVIGGIVLSNIMPLFTGGNGGRPVVITHGIDVPGAATSIDSRTPDSKPDTKRVIEPKLSLATIPPVPPHRAQWDEPMKVLVVNNTNAAGSMGDFAFGQTGCDDGQGKGFEPKPNPQEVASRIIAFSLDSDSHCACSQTVLHAWTGGRSISEVTRAELLELGLETSCITTPDRIMVVAVSGPVDDLPTTDEQVVELARCVDLNPSDDGLIEYLGHDEGKYAAAAMSCLTSGLQVEVVTLLSK